jgi:AcrR family transcriptional regulator
VGPKPTVAGGSDTADAPRPMRADAQRNRTRILEAAEVVFAAEGIEVPVDTIAEKAGVGVGTLYRHFPTKEKLCEAILLERLTGLAEDARAAADAADPGAAFFGFLNHMAEMSASKRDLIAAVMGAGIEFEEAAAPVKENLIEAVGLLLQRAQSVGVVRSDVTADTVVSLVVGTCQAAVAHADSFPSEQLGNVLGIVCDGLRCHD